MLVKSSKTNIVENSFLTQAVMGYYTHTFSTDGWVAGNYYVTLRNNGLPLTKKLAVR